MTERRLRLVHSAEPSADRWVCTWCGSRFDERADLEAHWQAEPECSRHRFVNNPSTSVDR